MYYCPYCCRPLQRYDNEEQASIKEEKQKVDINRIMSTCNQFVNT